MRKKGPRDTHNTLLHIYMCDTARFPQTEMCDTHMHPDIWGGLIYSKMHIYFILRESSTNGEKSHIQAKYKI